MEIAHNHNAKSQLAKLLATENITVQHVASARTAAFDVKARTLILPVWREMSNDLYDLLVVHEVGHALDTPPDGWLDAIKDIALRVTGSASNRAMGAVKGFLNVIEDARIDKRQKRRFPGARRNYVKGYAELIEKDFFGTKTKDVNSMTFIDRLNIYFKGGAMSGIKFSDEEKSLLKRVDDAETFDEVLSLTEEIFKWSKEKQEEQNNQNENDETAAGSGDDEGEGEFEIEIDFDDDDAESSSGSSNEDGDDDDTADTEDGDSSDDFSDEHDDVEIGSSRNEQTEILPESETEKVWQERQNELVRNSDEEYIYIKIPRPHNYDAVVNDYKIVLADQRECFAQYWNQDWLKSVRDELQDFKSKEKDNISFMVKEFEMRKSADEYMRTSVSKTGVIDMNKLYSYKYNDDLFRRITNVASGKNHGFVMFIDWSGSMSEYLKKTVKQLLSFAMFCRRVQIPFEVYAFRNACHWDSEIKGRVTDNMFTSNPNELHFDNFVARNFLSSRMSVQEMNDAMFHLYALGCGANIKSDNLHSTPLNECIGVADLIVNRFKSRSKVQIVNTIFLTDGDSDPIHAVHGVPHYSPKKRNFILQDEITKKSYNIRPNNDYYRHSAPYSERNMTSLLLEVLKDRVGGNLIGFYITSYSFDSLYSKFNGQSGDAEKTAKSDWRDNGFFGVKNQGYDEYYILNSKSLDIKQNKMSIDATMTKAKAAREFIKFSEKKAVSRVLLSRFVKRIAA